MEIRKEIKVRDIPGKICGMVYITPEQAERILKENGNPSNRTINATSVVKYAKDMSNGDFAETTMISFDKDGMLLDGHHRMKALSKAECEGQWFVMLYGAKNDRFIFDRGRQRTATQNINMSDVGFKVIGNDLAIANILIDVAASFMQGNVAVASQNRASDAELQDFIKENVANFESLHRVIAKNGYMTRKASVAGGIFQALKCGVDEELLGRFQEVLNNGYMTGNEESAAITLRKQLEKEFKPGGTNRILFEHTTEEAIAAFITGTPRQKKFSGMTCPYTMLLMKK